MSYSTRYKDKYYINMTEHLKVESEFLILRAWVIHRIVLL